MPTDSFVDLSSDKRKKSIIFYDSFLKVNEIKHHSATVGCATNSREINKLEKNVEVEKLSWRSKA